MCVYQDGSSSVATFPSVEDACGAGVTVADLNSTEYLTLFSDTIVAIDDNGIDIDIDLTVEEIERRCEVSVCEKNRFQVLGVQSSWVAPCNLSTTKLLWYCRRNTPKYVRRSSPDEPELGAGSGTACVQVPVLPRDCLGLVSPGSSV